MLISAVCFRGTKNDFHSIFPEIVSEDRDFINFKMYRFLVHMDSALNHISYERP